MKNFTKWLCRTARSVGKRLPRIERFLLAGLRSTERLSRASRRVLIQIALVVAVYHTLISV